MKAVLAFVASMSLTLPAAAISPGQLEDFQDGQTGGWFGALFSVPCPFAESRASVESVGGGQLGASDLFLQVTSDGFGAGGRLVMRNTDEWSGDYTGTGLMIWLPPKLRYINAVN